MATDPKGAVALAPAGGVKGAISRFLRLRGAALPTQEAVDVRPMPAEGDWGSDWIDAPVSLATLAGTANRPMRSRQQLYDKWADMLADPIISSGMRLHTTNTLGGHESKGQMVFVECAAQAKGNKQLEALVQELADDLTDTLNRIAPVLCFQAYAFGDSYGRLFTEPGRGVVDIYTDELVYPPLVQPYERGNQTIGYLVATGSRFREKLSILQMARMKMPRLVVLPQDRIIEKAIRMTLRAERLEDMPPVPGLAGGSFLDGSEGAYDKFSAAWAGLVGQRVQDSIDESLVGITMANTTKEQRTKMIAAIRRMFETSNAYIRQVVSEGKPVFGRVFHFLPANQEKQLFEVKGAPSQGRSSSLTIDDVQMHARFLAGSLGLDLSMLGFADLMSGGLGEGGFFRVSAQSGERARMGRASLTECLNHILRVHVLLKKKIDLTGQPLPWTINYYSGISALETERAKTRADNMNSGALLLQILQQIKELGLDKESAQLLMETELGIDADVAKKYAAAIDKAIAEAKKQAAAEAGGGFGGGGFGGGFGGGGPGGEPQPGELPVEPAEG